MGVELKGLCGAVFTAACEIAIETKGKHNYLDFR
jgi:hypothetical protein